MTKEQINALLAPFSAEEVQWRLRNSNDNGGYAVPYLDSRAIQNRLDEVLGKENWQNAFTCAATGNQKESVATICTISIYFADRGEWVSKSDGAGPTDIEPVKGGLSDAFKRAASMWGVGRYMYELSDVWVNTEMKGKSKVVAESSKPKLADTYNKAIARIFGTAPKTDAKPTSPAKPQPEKALSKPVFEVISSKITNGKKQSTTVHLRQPDGSNVTGYIPGSIELPAGQKLTDVRLEEKQHESAGSYYVITGYNKAA